MVETLETSHTWSRGSASCTTRSAAAIRDSLAGAGDARPRLLPPLARLRRRRLALLHLHLPRPPRRRARAVGGGQAGRLRGDRRRRRHDHPPPRGRPRPRPLHGGRGRGDRARGAAGGQGAARPGRDHEPRQAAPLAGSPCPASPVFDDRAGDRRRGATSCRPCRSAACFASSPAPTSRSQRGVVGDGRLPSGRSPLASRRERLRRRSGTGTAMLARLRHLDGGDASGQLRRLGEPDRVGLDPFGRRFEALTASTSRTIFFFSRPKTARPLASLPSTGFSSPGSASPLGGAGVFGERWPSRASDAVELEPPRPADRRGRSRSGDRGDEPRTAPPAISSQAPARSGGIAALGLAWRLRRRAVGGDRRATGFSGGRGGTAPPQARRQALGSRAAPAARPAAAARPHAPSPSARTCSTLEPREGGDVLVACRRSARAGAASPSGRRSAPSSRGDYAMRLKANLPEPVGSRRDGGRSARPALPLRRPDRHRVARRRSRPRAGPGGDARRAAPAGRPPARRRDVEPGRERLLAARPRWR